MLREAKCSCGQLGVITRGDPQVVAVCSCLQCQQRTGSAFGVSSYFNGDQIVEKFGEYTSFESTAEEGRKVVRCFCPVCGSTVFWQAELFPSKTGVAVGCFADPNFPAPIASVWNKSKHPWVTLPSHWHECSTQTIARPEKSEQPEKA